MRRARAVLEVRAKVLQAIRRFFVERKFLEVETPVRLKAPAPEVHIEAEASGDYFLRTSPELHMKRLLAAGYERLFQVGPCFRRGEKGQIHHPEYTMLEWYRANADYHHILVDARALITFVAREVLGGTDLSHRGQPVALWPIWDYVTVADAFRQHAGWDPIAAFDADRFDLDLVEKVEPRLPKNVPVVLADYPADAAALARRKKDQPAVAERWELYIGGLELANAYSELTDAGEQEDRFRAWSRRRRELGKAAYPPDQAFLDALGSGMPASGGIALGVDRLVMLLTDSASLEDVVAFCE
ncbi:MAG: EF-P lysine aminoacylase EpmA [Verrucomicrobiota bacterium]